jgi:hypothetical protein
MRCNSGRFMPDRRNLLPQRHAHQQCAGFGGTGASQFGP